MKLNPQEITRLFTGKRREHSQIDDADLADYLELIKKTDEEHFFKYLSGLPAKLQAETTIELPGPFQRDYIARLEDEQLLTLVDALETDDATDLMQLILSVAPQRAETLFAAMDEERERAIRRLLRYDERQAGSLMQSEVFTARADETIDSSLRRLKKLKQENGHSYQHVFVIDEKKRLLRVIAFAELIVTPRRSHYSELLDDYPEPYRVDAEAPLEDAVNMIDRYDLAVLSVVDSRGHLLGRITHDDVLDAIQQRATGQMYGLSRMSAEEVLQEGALTTGRSRALWLGLNLINATLVSLVIGLFEHILEAFVALAILMPIVANMAGTASVQTLTVIVRQMSLGELHPANRWHAFAKEFTIAMNNGVLFGVLSIGLAWVWFKSWSIALVMGGSMAFSFVCAGLLGAGVPYLLKRLNIDPAVASAVIVITLVDVIGFFSFLWLASLFLM